MNAQPNLTTTPEMTRRDAVEYVRSLKNFYRDLISYSVINILLVVINLILSPHHLWFYWVTIFWGLGIFYHALNVFGSGRKFSRDWENRKIQEYMNKRNNHS